jgi:hypothetical protein
MQLYKEKSCLEPLSLSHSLSNTHTSCCLEEAQNYMHAHTHPHTHSYTFIHTCRHAYHCVCVSVCTLVAASACSEKRRSSGGRRCHHHRRGEPPKLCWGTWLISRKRSSERSRQEQEHEQEQEQEQESSSSFHLMQKICVSIYGRASRSVLFIETTHAHAHAHAHGCVHIHPMHIDFCNSICKDCKDCKCNRGWQRLQRLQMQSRMIRAFEIDKSPETYVSDHQKHGTFQSDIFQI